MTTEYSCKFRVGDRVKVIKNSTSLSLKDWEGVIVVIPKVGASTVIGIDFGKVFQGSCRLYYYDHDSYKSRTCLPKQTGAWFYQSYLKLSGPPDDGGDWI